MSKFSQMIRARVIDGVLAKPERLSTPFDFSVEPILTKTTYKKLYRVGIQLEADCFIDISDPHAAERLSLEKERITRMFVEFIFGEFRQDINYLRQYAAQDNMDEVQNRLALLDEKMFKI